MSIAQLIQEFQCRVEQALDRWLPLETVQPRRLHEAMRYAVLGQGKRVRPSLVYATGYVIGVEGRALDGPASAVELVHAYSLVHDDLPSMDNDDLRRGRPTCHRAFDEATAILAGDALQALAFRVLAHDPEIRTTPSQRLEMIDTLAHACGSRGMAGGQAIDLEAVGRELNLAELENMHIHKTGALIRASVKLGALSQPDIDRDLLAKLDHYAKCIGLAFQVQDDILDVEGHTEILGKPQGSDIARNKPTYPNLLGLEGARQAAAELYHEAVESLATLGQAAEPLRWIADYIIRRDR
ncbi:MAG TPA: farnesyl diphosphate synthase [Gammaproteobacteria bacterium]|nr:farnesyl diphosphate synthase [Gammaproteobacteria bacterium]